MEVVDEVAVVYIEEVATAVGCAVFVFPYDM